MRGNVNVVRLLLSGTSFDPSRTDPQVVSGVPALVKPNLDGPDGATHAPQLPRPPARHPA